MNRTILALFALATLAAGSLSAQDDFKMEDGYVSLFNGKDLSGWEYGSVPPVKNPPPVEKLEGKTQSSDGVFLVKDGLLIASGKKIKALYTTKEYNKDFQIKLEFRASADKPKDNSGLFLRKWQLQLDATHEKGSLTGTFRNIKNFKVGGWNEIDVTVRGTEATCHGRLQHRRQELSACKVASMGNESRRLICLCNTLRDEHREDDGRNRDSISPRFRLQRIKSRCCLDCAFDSCFRFKERVCGRVVKRIGESS